MSRPTAGCKKGSLQSSSLTTQAQTAEQLCSKTSRSQSCRVGWFVPTSCVYREHHIRGRSPYKCQARLHHGQGFSCAHWFIAIFSNTELHGIFKQLFVVCSSHILATMFLSPWDVSRSQSHRLPTSILQRWQSWKVEQQLPGNMFQSFGGYCRFLYHYIIPFSGNQKNVVVRDSLSESSWQVARTFAGLVATACRTTAKFVLQRSDTIKSIPMSWPLKTSNSLSLVKPRGKWHYIHRRADRVADHDSIKWNAEVLRQSIWCGIFSRPLGSGLIGELQ